MQNSMTGLFYNMFYCVVFVYKLSDFGGVNKLSYLILS